MIGRRLGIELRFVHRQRSPLRPIHRHLSPLLSMPPRRWAGLFEFNGRFAVGFVDSEDPFELLAIDPYAAESPGEFFAVVSEAFFETPELLEPEYPALYEQLRAFYRQDPGARLA